MAISIITIDGESYDVGASAGNVAFNNSGTGISAGTVQGAIEEISSTGGGGGGYEPPVGGIPYNDLAQTVRNSLDKADTALQSESDPVFAASAAHGITSTDINNWNNKANSAAIPTKTSDLTNDSGFVTAEDIEDFVTAESIEEIVMGSADVSVIEAGGYINIVFATASITFSPDTTMSLYSGQKTGTLTVSGTHLKQDITLAVPIGFTAQVSGGTAAQSITIPQTDGEVSGVSVTITYTGADSGSYTGSITATSGSTTASVGLVYSQYQGATIIAGTIDTIKAAIGSPQIGELNVSGVNLEDDISASVGNGDFTICATQNGTYGTTATISKTSAEASGGATLYVKYTPSSGTSTASDTLTLTTPRNGANLSKTVTLTGAVSTLTVSPSSLSLSTEAGTPATKTFTVQGANLTQDISISASGTGFSVLPATIDKDDAATEQTVTVTYSPSETGTNTGSITLQSGGATATVTLEGTASAGLPTGYTKLTYLQGITRQMQSPVITFPQTWEFDVQCDALTTNIQILLCTASSGGKWIGASNNGKWGVGITDATCTTVQVTTRATILATLKSTGVEITIGNETITRDADSALTGYAWLFGCNETDKRLFGGKIYSVRLVSGGTADLVLASRDSDGQQGIYNLTNNTFYGLT